MKGIVTGQSIPDSLRENAVDLRRRMTPAETKLWSRLRADRLEGWHFRRQQIVGRYILDFYCHQVALAVEVDGAIHQSQVDYDQARDDFLRARGLSILRFSNQDVERQIDIVLAAILEECRKLTGETA